LSPDGLKGERTISADFYSDNRVSVVSVFDSHDKTQIKHATRKAIDAIGGMGSIVGRGDLVLVKPNLVVPRTSYSGITTDLTMLEEVVSEVSSAKGKAVIGESSSIGYDQDLTFFILRIRHLASRIGAKVVNFDKVPLKETTVPNGVMVKRIKLPEIVGDADLIVNMPKLKTHELTGVTVGLKNVLGFLPRKKKQWTHIFNLDQSLVDLNKVIRCGLTVVDGVIGMEGNGPALGTPINTNVIIAGRNPIRVDEVSCRAMGVEPLKVAHLKLATEQLPHGRDGVKVLGNLKTRKFKMPTRPHAFLMAERVIFTLNYLLYSKLTMGGDILPIRARLIRQIPRILLSECDKCGQCAKSCPTNAIDSRTMTVSMEKCLGCMVCAEFCRRNAIKTTPKTDLSGICGFFGERFRRPPKLLAHKCVDCGECISMCPTNAITLSEGVIRFDAGKCIRCVDKLCQTVCKRDAIR